jgi:predicted RNase H-like HicB family nuclease
MVEIEPLQVEIEREDEGRYLASVPDLPGVMAYGETEEAALRRAKAIALQVLADMIENSEELPQALRVVVRSMSIWSAIKPAIPTT